MRNFHQYGIDTKGRNSGKIKTICPQCNDTRGHKGDKSFSVNLNEGVCYCHHCGYKLYVPDANNAGNNAGKPANCPHTSAAPPSTLQKQS